MTIVKRMSFILLASTACVALSACDGADSVGSPGEGVIVVPATPTPSPTPSPTPTPTPGTPATSCPTGTTDVGIIGNYRSCRLPSAITSALSLPKVAGVAYEINGRVDVGVDVGGAGSALGGIPTTLTIAAGSLIYANTTNSDNDFMVVNRGSKLIAEGTETQPIIFTAQANLTGGVNDESQGLWGGIILAGRAPISNCNTTVTGGSAACENVVEGTSTALYGGAVPTDSSGTVRYVQIRYSGTVISPNNELQGLTLGGTGSATVLDHIQIHNSSDDGIEIFGGRSNLRYLAITGADDDGLDTDVGWQGFVQFVLAIQKPSNTTGDNYSTEIDSNNNEDALPRQRYNLANFTFVQTSTATNAAIRLRGGADAVFVNGIVSNPGGACLNVIAGADASGKTTIRPANAALEDNGPPVFNSVVFSCTTPYAETAVNGITVTTAEQQALFRAGSNNTEAAAAGSVLTGTFLPAGVASTTTAFNASTLNPSGTAFLVNTSYVGAVNGSTDTWYRGWTCNSNRASFGTTSSACTALPTS